MACIPQARARDRGVFPAESLRLRLATTASFESSIVAGKNIEGINEVVLKN